MKQQLKRTLGLVLFLIVVGSSGYSQAEIVSLEDAIEIAKKNYATLERDRLSISQYEHLADVGMRSQPAQIFLSGEEFGIEGQSGIHSLNVQQSFYLPKANEAQKKYFQKGALVAEKQMNLTEREVIKNVTHAYYQLLVAKEEQSIAHENVLLFENFYTVATSLLENGETGKIPQLAARTRLGQAHLEEEHTKEKLQIATVLFNQWLGAESQYDIEGNLLQVGKDSIENGLAFNPRIQIIEAQREMANSAIELERAKLLPQINTGAMIQTVNGSFPAFGYQMGVNVPLFRKSYKGRIEAAEAGVLVQEAALEAELQRLDRTITELQFRIEHQLHILEYLSEEFRPIVEEQREVNLLAYREGEISYLEYLNSLEQVVLAKQQYLEALFEYNHLQVELNYYLGK